MLELLKELEALPQCCSPQDLDSATTKGTDQEEVHRITLSDPTTEVFPAGEVGGWERVSDKTHNESVVKSQSRLGSREQRQSIVEDVVVSPSRFTPLMARWWRIRRRKSLIPWRRRTETGYLDRRIGDELQRADDEDEHLHDVSVAAEHVGEGVIDLGLDLVLIEPGGSSQFDEDERERIEPIRPRPNTCLTSTRTPAEDGLRYGQFRITLRFSRYYFKVKSQFSKFRSLSSSSSSAAAVIALNLKDANWWLDVNESPFWQDRILRILAGLYGIVSVTVIAVIALLLILWWKPVQVVVIISKMFFAVGGDIAFFSAPLYPKKASTKTRFHTVPLDPNVTEIVDGDVCGESKERGLRC
ncbi:hypothetical protein F2Q69_00063363 [Brassica cretica]|uniref:Uncharacterized protein n=1 Tax=Brassica cretica TaxID=69181 RepID=A0A8S9RPX6_BRACR|nr:hypothetical protein F2Q69_00063363 [Brassica cretica]